MTDKPNLVIAFDNFWADDNTIFNEYFKSTHFFLWEKYNVQLAHVNASVPSRPDVIFMSTFPHMQARLYEPRGTGPVRILINHEPYQYRDLCNIPHDYFIGFDTELIGANLFRIPYWVYKMYDYYSFFWNKESTSDWDSFFNMANNHRVFNPVGGTQDKTISQIADLTLPFDFNNHTKDIAYIQTKGVPYRDHMVNLFRENGMSVNSGGRWDNNLQEPLKSLMLQNLEGKLSLLQKHYFLRGHKASFAMENTPDFAGYTTEKLIDSFAGGTIPFYCGTLHLADGFNQMAIENLKDYNFPDIYVKNMKLLLRDNAKYEKVWNQPLFTKYPEKFRPDAMLELYTKMFERKI